MSVEIARRGAARKFPVRKLKKLALGILKLLQRDEAELSLALVDNAEIRKLNAQFRQKDEPTDVLSFPVRDRAAPALTLLGDVVISVERAAEQAEGRRRTLDQELATLLIHGILHLLDYDHERSPRDARIMGAMEKKIYRALCDQGLIQV